MDVLVRDLTEVKWMVIGNTTILDPRHREGYMKHRLKVLYPIPWWLDIHFKAYVAAVFLATVHVLYKGHILY